MGVSTLGLSNLTKMKPNLERQWVDFDILNQNQYTRRQGATEDEYHT